MTIREVIAKPSHGNICLSLAVSQSQAVTAFILKCFYSNQLKDWSDYKIITQFLLSLGLSQLS